MEPDGLESARARYRAAYEAYQERSRRVAQKLENGETPTVGEITAEAEATENLAKARREFLDAMAHAWPGGHH